MAGQPTKYKPEYCTKIVQFFEEYEYFTKSIVTENVGGKLETFEKLTPNKVPSLVKFARSIKVSRRVLLNWAEDYPEFLRALNDAKELIEEAYQDMGLRGYYNPVLTKYFASNYTELKETQTVEHAGQANFSFNIVEAKQKKENE